MKKGILLYLFSSISVRLNWEDKEQGFDLVCLTFSSSVQLYETMNHSCEVIEIFYIMLYEFREYFSVDGGFIEQSNEERIPESVFDSFVYIRCF